MVYLERVLSLGAGASAPPLRKAETFGFVPSCYTATEACLPGSIGSMYRPLPVEDYRKERIAELGEFIGTVIAGIYEGIRNGHFDNDSDFEAAAGRAHQSWEDYFESIVER